MERLGVERARRAAEEAELALLVLDGSRPLAEEDRAAEAAARRARHVIVLQNKCDLPQVMLAEGALPVSARDGTGLDRLEAAVAAFYPAGGAPAGQVLTNARQAEAVGRAAGALRGAREALEGGLTPDAALSDTERAMNALGELTGRTLREDLVARIFERFCVGK